MEITLSAMFIPVHDPDAALVFYRDALGLEVRNDVASGGFRWVTVGAPGQDVGIVLFQPHGGLSPRAMRRVREYVEAHLSETIDLANMAAVAGLSLFHFAREFKHSTGVTPHYYLLQKRVERAQTMLVRTDFTLSDIALASGFSDQSHLTRHFRRMLGTTPREFRWSQRL